MSTDNQNVPPAGEEIHLPSGSLQPHALTAGITIFLLGLTQWPLVAAAGLVIVVWTIALWIRDARREYNSLPVHHHDDHDGSEPAADPAPSTDPAAGGDPADTSAA